MFVFFSVRLHLKILGFYAMLFNCLLGNFCNCVCRLVVKLPPNSQKEVGVDLGVIGPEYLSNRKMLFVGKRLKNGSFGVVWLIDDF